jgi:nitronate monooxygenase
MLRTRFTDLVGCTVPIQQAPIGGCASPRLAAAVTAAGGLGMVSVTGDPPDIVAAQLDRARQLSAGPIGAHFFLLVTDPDSARVRRGRRGASAGRRFLLRRPRPEPRRHCARRRCLG